MLEFFLIFIFFLFAPYFSGLRRIFFFNLLILFKYADALTIPIVGYLSILNMVVGELRDKLLKIMNMIFEKGEVPTNEIAS
jgi:hypothetical protein